MPRTDMAERVAQLYTKIADKCRLPYRLSHARQPNDSDPHEDDGVLAYGQKHVGDFFDRSERAVNEFGKK